MYLPLSLCVCAYMVCVCVGGCIQLSPPPPTLLLFSLLPIKPHGWGLDCDSPTVTIPTSKVYQLRYGGQGGQGRGEDDNDHH